MSAIDTLDLHGVPHSRVEERVEEFITFNATPCRIITGNSPTMQNFIKKVIEKYDLVSDYENDYNLGAMIIGEK
jgi:hypothetical protein